ncbi:MAG: nucleotidyltransferase domain-containing protein [Sphaerochaetaceae bacterium]|nr:nucleotidyltransferase domain-containing protein [Sphaerochaetaceae bacterium]
MTVQELRDKGWIIFEAISGSQAYGTALPTSDTDIRGIFIMPTTDVLKANPTTDGNYPYIPQVNDETNDVTFYEIGRFIELLEKGNPNILELLNVPEDCIVYKSPLFDKYFSDKDKYITKKLKYTFAGYAATQIGKARGMNKKIHNPQPKVRKTIEDFCYVIEGAQTRPLKEVIGESLLKNCGITKLPQGRGLFALHTDPMEKFQFRGIVKENKESVTNEVRLSSIPKEYFDFYHPTLEGVQIMDEIGHWNPKPRAFLFNIYFDQDGYSVHCKQHKEYWEWVDKRNPQRYKDNMKGEVGYDHKNMMHCVRLVEVAEDIINKGEIVVRRPNRHYLLSIRNGEHKYEDLLAYVENKVEGLDDLFDNSNLPDEVDREQTRELLLTIRLEN